MKPAKRPVRERGGFLRFLPILIIILVVTASHLYIALAPANSMMRWFTVDDAYYYFKTAENISEGKGVTFDGINAANGFHPLWMAVCIPVFTLARLDRILALRVLVGVLGVFNAATGVVLYLLLSKALSKFLSLAAALFWVLYPGVISATSAMGLEAGINAFFIVLLLLLASRYVFSKEKKKSSIIWVGLVAALAILSRLDNIFLVGVIGLWIVLRDTRLARNHVVDAIMAAILMIVACIIRMGLSTNYVSMLTAIYLMLFLAVIVKPLLLWLFKVDEELKVRIWGIRWIRIACAILSSTIMIMVFMQVALVFRFINAYPRLALLYDFLLSLLFFIGLRLIEVIKQKKGQYNHPTFSWRSWIRSNWKRVLMEGVYLGAPILILVGGYLIWNYVNFGVLSPISGQVKHWWSTLTSTVYGHKVDYLTLIGLSPYTNIGPWSLVTSGLFNLAYNVSSILAIKEQYILLIYVIALCVYLIGVIGFTLIDPPFVKKSSLRTGVLFLFLGAILHIFYYNVTAYPNTRFWYWIAEMLCLVIFNAILLETFLRWLSKYKIKRIFNYTILGLLLVWLLYTSGVYFYKIIPPTVRPGEEQMYLSEVRALEMYTEKGSLIGMTGGGTIAYFIDGRTIVNLDGLMNSPEYFRALMEWKAGEFLDKMGLNYVFGNEYMLFHSSPYRNFLPDRLVKIGRITGEDRFTLFKYYPLGAPR